MVGRDLIMSILLVSIARRLEKHTSRTLFELSGTQEMPEDGGTMSRSHMILPKQRKPNDSPTNDSVQDLKAHALTPAAD